MAYTINDALVGTYNASGSTLTGAIIIALTAINTIGSLVFIGF